MLVLPFCALLADLTLVCCIIATYWLHWLILSLKSDQTKREENTVCGTLNYMTYIILSPVILENVFYIPSYFIYLFIYCLLFVKYMVKLNQIRFWRQTFYFFFFFLHHCCCTQHPHHPAGADGAIYHSAVTVLHCLTDTVGTGTI